MAEHNHSAQPRPSEHRALRSHVRVAIIGAGFSGMGSAIALERRATHRAKW